MTRTSRLLAAAALVILATPMLGAGSPPTLADFFHAIADVESDFNDDAVGDNGKSIGRYQIGEAYWKDARMGSGEWEDVRDPKYAEQVMISYWARYADGAVKRKDWQRLARIHNGGPRGHKKKATLGYWREVQKAMEN